MNRYLQQLVTAQGARNRELEQALRAYRGSSSAGGSEAGVNAAGDAGMHGAGSPDGDDGRTDEMMLHDANGDSMDFGGGGGGGYSGGGMLPSMPEDDDELELELALRDEGMGMDVDGARGRTRGVKRANANANGVNVPLKEEGRDDDLGFMHAVQA